MRDYGYTHYHVEMSKLVREGFMSRDRALQNLDMEFSDEMLNEILGVLNLNVEHIR
jgi:hypothetical protein